MSVLLLDIGNSRLKWGVHRDDELRDTGDVDLRKIVDYKNWEFTKKWSNDVDSVVACNVAGNDVGKVLSARIMAQYGHELHFVRSERTSCGVTNSYHEPRQLGVDRWVAMIGARASCKNACVIVDAGTAITIDALDADGHHLGGQILPGIVLMMEALEMKTSDLPLISSQSSDAHARPSVLANSTAIAISKGVTSAAIGAVEVVLRALRSDGYELTIFLTGGDADRINGSLFEVTELRPSLVLEGLACIVERS